MKQILNQVKLKFQFQFELSLAQLSPSLFFLLATLISFSSLSIIFIKPVLNDLTKPFTAYDHGILIQQGIYCG